MDSKQTALTVVLVLGGMGLLISSCSEDDKHAEKSSAAKHSSKADHGKGHEVHWAYDGEGGPEAWGELKAEYELCGSGKSQSPIDISQVTITGLPEIEFHYQETPLVIGNNGHTIQVNYGAGSYITVAGKQYDLLQFHFHSPSEHAVGGKYYDMVAHLVHKSSDGQLGVVGVVFEADRGINNTLAKLWLHMPANAGETNQSDGVLFNAADLLPSDLGYFSYSGSLTTPPCSEGVNWMVLGTANHIAPAQVKQFTDLFPLSSRPVQPLNGRVVKESN